MTFEKYGEMFKELRVQKGRKRDDFEKIGISRSALTKFENGQSMMGFDRVLDALEELGITLEEFDYFTNNFTIDCKVKLLADTERYLIANDILSLKKLLKFSIHNQDIILEIIIKSELKEVSEDEIEVLTSYLYEVKKWGYFELYAFYLTLENLNYKDVMYLIEMFFEKWKLSLIIEKFNLRMTYILYKASAILTNRGRKTASYYLLNRMPSDNISTDMFATNIRNLVDGFYTFKFKNADDGKIKVQRALKLMEELCSYELHDYFVLRYSNFMNLDLINN